MILVFLIHLFEFLCAKAPAGSIDRNVIELLYPFGSVAGRLFIVISGCFLYRSLLLNPVSYREFLSRRLVRIYSVFSTVLMIYVVLSYLFPSASKLPAGMTEASRYILANLLLLPGIFPIQPIITVSWTLSYIVLYCIVLPPLMQLTRLRSCRPSRRVMYLVGFSLLLGFGSVTTGKYPIQLLYLPLGSLGCEALLWRQRNRRAAMWVEPALAGISALAFCTKLLYLHLHHWDFVTDWSQGYFLISMNLLCLLTLCFPLFSPNASWHRMLSWAPLRRLGTMSYSYYLTHSLVIKMLSLFGSTVAMLATSAIGFWLVAVIAMCTSLVTGAFVFALVEKPVANLGAVKRRPPRRPALTVACPVQEAAQTPQVALMR